MNDYFAKLIACDLTRRSPSDSLEKFAATLSDAQVMPVPHQVDAALFAFRSPLSQGAILADEVGLGKTIEAGILLSQHWAQRQRRLLVILPSSLRKQWHQELAEKFFLPAVILEKRSFDQAINAGNLNPFDDDSRIVLCSYHFAKSKYQYVTQTAWDLVIVDEAHRLRNVYKPKNKIANVIKQAIAGRKKVLLTATPLQNSLAELYGLVSIVDEYVFGDLASFQDRYRSEEPQVMEELKARLASVCQRTLRSQVQEYVRYTRRIPMTQEFVPHPDEQKLYDMVTEYLRSDRLYALPAAQRQLMTLILRRLLASSSHAIAGTLGGLAQKLEDASKAQRTLDLKPEEVASQYEPLESTADEWVDDDDEAEDDSDPDDKDETQRLSREELEASQREATLLREIEALAHSIGKNAKGEVLITALEQAFTTATKLGAPRKAVIFTESTRTQDYIQKMLADSPYKTVLFNGTNAGEQTKQIYKDWVERHKGTAKISGSRSADTRQALVDEFRDSADIMIATEAAAEGINLQFCNLVVNFDLPWNPQRVEQRIGRCHRFGQQHDVVVVNFLNQSNAADVLVYALLAEKFQLFEGVFGASDDVLGAVASGVDFEKRISQILQECRSPDEISAGFASLRAALEAPIEQRMAETRQKILAHLDVEVQEKLRLSLVEGREALSRVEGQLWNLTRKVLGADARFEETDKDGPSFELLRNPFPDLAVAPGPYRLSKTVEDAYRYRINHPLAQRVIQRCLEFESPDGRIAVDLDSAGVKVAALEPFRGAQGWLCVERFSLEGNVGEDHLLVVAWDGQGRFLDDSQARRLLSLAPSIESGAAMPGEQRTQAESLLAQRRTEVRAQWESRNHHYFDDAFRKLDAWAMDQKQSLELELRQLDRQIGEARAAYLAVAGLDEKVAQQRKVRDLEALRHSKRMSLYQAQDAVEGRRDEVLKEVEGRLRIQPKSENLFVVEWKLD